MRSVAEHSRQACQIVGHDVLLNQLSRPRRIVATAFQSDYQFLYSGV